MAGHIFYQCDIILFIYDSLVQQQIDAVIICVYDQWSDLRANRHLFHYQSKLLINIISIY